MSPAKENTDIFNKWAPSYYDIFTADNDDEDDNDNDTLQRYLKIEAIKNPDSNSIKNARLRPRNSIAIAVLYWTFITHKS
jgi:hypothetical protein